MARLKVQFEEFLMRESVVSVSRKVCYDAEAPPAVQNISHFAALLASN